MANQITDNRTLVDSANAITDYVSSAGPTQDTEVKIQGTASVGEQISNNLRYLHYRHPTAAQDWSNNTFYIWVNCGIVGLLDTKANGGFRIRFTGNTNTDYFEVYVGGSDSWPVALEGGWVQFVVDIEEARSQAVTNGWTNGTTPATTAIREVGWAGQTSGAMTRNTDNTWIDEIRRLPSNTPGIIIEGRDGGSTDWDSSDIATQLGIATGTFVESVGGAYKVNTPIQFGINDTTTHGFTDTNSIWLWDDQEFITNSLYGISALGNSGGTTNVTFGSKSGTGVSASGSQGLTIAASSTGVRWDMDFDDPDLDSIDFYGCSFQHGGDFQLDDVAVESIDSLYIDVTTVEVTNSDLFSSNNYINSNTAADNGALVWNENIDVDGILDGSSFSMGANSHHAISFGTAVTTNLTLRNMSFNGFGSTDDTNDSTVQFLATSGSLTLSLVGCTVDGSAATTGNFSVDDAAGVTVTLSIDPVTTEINVKDENGANLSGAYVYLEAANGTGDLPFEETVTITRSGTTATVSHTAHGLNSNEYVKLAGITDKTEDNNGAHQITVSDANTYTYTTTDSGSTSYTGTITSTGATIYGTTDASGNISSSRTYGSNQPLVGQVRKSSSGSTRYKTFPLSNTVNSSTGLSISVQLVKDE